MREGGCETERSRLKSRMKTFLGKSRELKCTETASQVFTNSPTFSPEEKIKCTGLLGSEPGAWHLYCPESRTSRVFPGVSRGRAFPENQR